MTLVELQGILRSFITCRYLGGVLDFTGELNRYAVACATKRDAAAVSRCRDVVDALMGQFLQFGMLQAAATAHAAYAACYACTATVEQY